jgi:uncharacterized YigZ family protein
MVDPIFFQTIEKATTAEFSDRGSRFIAYAFPVHSIDEFKKTLQQLKKEQPKASHFCFAYRISADRHTYRVSDAGEPSGSAGRPILGQIDSKELTNVCVIVIRFFGGTLLGIPGLINAYKSSASMALQLTPVVKKPVEILYELEFDYTMVNEVLKIIRRFGCSIHSQEIQLFCRYEIGIQKSNEAECVDVLKDISGFSIKQKSDPA